VQADCEVGAVARIVVAVDGNPDSSRVVAWALQHAQSPDDSVQVIMTVSTGGLDEPHRVSRLLGAEQALQAVVEAGRVASAGSDVRVSRSVVEGDPTAVLNEATRGSDLLVLASHHLASIPDGGITVGGLGGVRAGACSVLVLPCGQPQALSDGIPVPSGTAA